MNTEKMPLHHFYTQATPEPTAHFLTKVFNDDYDQHLLVIVGIPFTSIKSIIRTGLLLRHDTLGIDEMQMNLKQHPLQMTAVDSPIFSDLHPVGAYDSQQAHDLMRGVLPLLSNDEPQWLPLTLVQANRFPITTAAESFCAEHFFIDVFGLLLDGYKFGTMDTYSSRGSLPWNKLLRFTEDNETLIHRQRIQAVSCLQRPGHSVYQLTKEAGGPVRHLIFHQDHPAKPGHTMWWTGNMQNLVTLTPAQKSECYTSAREAYTALLELQIQRVTYTTTNLANIEAGIVPRPLIEAAPVSLEQA
jgi:hypothetical protein